MNYPNKHYQVVKDLLNGKFILQEEILYGIINEYYEFYCLFFKESFKYNLIKTSKFLYLQSDDTSEKLSRNLMLILSILIDNLNNNNEDLSSIYQDYKIAEIQRIIKNSNYQKACQNITIETLIKNDCAKRNIVKLNENYGTFKFTNAIDIFLEEAKNIIKQSNDEQELM